MVFKMLFAEPRNVRLLVSLLTAVLRPASPIAQVTVLDPELPKDLASDRGVRLDVLVKLEDGKLVDVEMQCDPRRGHGARWLYHWARLYSGRLRRGDDYLRLEPVVSVVFLASARRPQPHDETRSPDRRFHSTYEVREVHDHALLSDVLAIHLVDLPRLEQASTEGEGVDLQRWARFLRFDDERALDSLASEEPIMAEAKHALEILSREPSAQRIAELRREAELARKLDRQEALAEGREQGRAEATRANIESVCRALAIELDHARRADLAALDEAGLVALLEAILARRAWP
ncbi:MAG: Rpn family recombination-promoting nuclease/putative transposase [Deltaproteobacteria bacterium]|nr:Rpn family recombination-promoting nuclease/putative transposase [Deltaproteobacteria bacterium]